MAGSWERLASTDNSTHTIDSGVFTAKEHLHVEIHYDRTETATLMAFGTGGSGTMDTSESNYGTRRNTDGSTDSGYAGTANPFDWGAYLGNGGAPSDGGGYLVMDIQNVADKKKVFSGYFIVSDSGASNGVTRMTFVGKWDNTSDQITRIQGWSGNNSHIWDSGTRINVWGADDQPSTPFYPKLQDGSIYEEQDTGKIYIWNLSTNTWSEI